MSDTSDEAVPDPKPPFWVKRVRLRNYKSIAFCDVALEPLTVLVGRNGAGKSNFLDAIAFVGELARDDIREVMNRRGGPDQIVRRGSDQKLSIQLTADVLATAAEHPTEVTYTFDYEAAADVRHQVRESVEWSDGELRESHGGIFQGPLAYLKLVKPIRPDRAEYSVTRSILRAVAELRDSDLYEGLRSICPCSIHPPALRDPKRRGPETFLTPDGSNAPSVYRYLRDSGSWRYERLQQFLRAIVPHLESVSPKKLDAYETLSFVVSGEEFPASAMSDGTLRAFGVLLAALQTTELEGDPSVILVEELEAGLHPAAMKALVAALDEAAMRVQVIATTHSPSALDAPEVTPARTRFVTAGPDGTTITPIDAASARIVAARLNTLGGLEAENRIGANTADVRRQQADQSAGAGAKP